MNIPASLSPVEQQHLDAATHNLEQASAHLERAHHSMRAGNIALDQLRQSLAERTAPSREPVKLEA